MKIKHALLVISIMLSSILVGSFTNVSAIVTSTNWNSPIVKKALLSGIYHCYTTGAIDDTVEKLSTFKGFSNVIIGGDNEDYIALPGGLTAITDNGVSCNDLFTGYGIIRKNSFEGLFKLSGKQASPSTKEGKITLLEGMGYHEKKDSNADDSKQKCVSFTYDQKVEGLGNSTKIQTEQLCAKLDDNNKITEIVRDASSATSIASTLGVNFFTITSNGKIKMPMATKSEIVDESNKVTEVITTKGVGDTWDDFFDDLRRTVSSTPTITYTADYGESVTYVYSLSGNTTAGNTNESDIGDIGYTIKDDGEGAPSGTDFIKAANSAIKYISNGSFSDYDSLKLTPNEQISLYTAIIKEHFYSNIDIDGYWRCNVNDWADFGQFSEQYSVKISPNGKKGDCRLNPSEVVNSSSISGVNGGGWFDVSGVSTPKLNLQGVLAALDKLADNVTEDEPADPTTGPTTDPTDDPENDPKPTPQSDPCYSGDVESMSWILCPAADNMAKATDGIIGGMIEDILTVSPDLYQVKNEHGDNSGTYRAWTYFRELANIAIIIVFLAIIFSQITGVGIDNYGIKKMLPKLIAMAILINLSYYICVLCIDASNIIGNALDNLFKTIGDEIGMTNYAQLTVSTIIDGLLAAAIGAGALAPLAVEGFAFVGATGSAGSIIVLLIPILLSLLIAIVSVLMLFVMLGARLVIVVLFTAVSPLAFVCNILPNTQKVFKRWVDIMKTALVMYPICGALHGLSFVIKAIVFSTDEIHILMGMVAIFSPFIPFLIIPTLVKGTLSTLGVVGQKLSGIGDTVKGSLRNAQSTVRNSEQYRDRARIAQEQHAGWKSMRQLGLNPDGKLRTDKKGRVKGLYGKLARSQNNDSTSFDEVKALDRSNLSDTDRRRLSMAEQELTKYNAGIGSTSAQNPYILSAEEAKRDAVARNYKNEVERIKVTLGNTGSNSELVQDIAKGWSNGSKEYRVAALSTMASRKMGKEMIQFLDKYGTKDLSNEELAAIQESDEGLVHTWAKEQSKQPNSDRVSFRKFMDGDGENSFKSAVSKNREKTVNMMTDDSFNYLGGRINELGNNTAIPAPSVKAVSNDLMLSKLANTTSGKEQTAIMENMLQGNEEIRLSYDSLTKIKGSTFFAGDDGEFSIQKFNKFMSRVDDGTLQTLKADYEAAQKKGAVRLDANTRSALDTFLAQKYTTSQRTKTNGQTGRNPEFTLNANEKAMARNYRANHDK